MCGIAGLFSLDGPLPPAAQAAIEPMTTSIAHRGPDGAGILVRARAALGHRRLAIIDRAHGAQPITNEDATRWIVFNGEIYNYRDLKTDLLARGHQFRTSSDTEVILHGYEQYGADIVDRLEGMFAFAIYDETREALLLARDRMGKKPLFYAVFGGVLHFASEIKALAHSPLWNDEVDRDGIDTYLSLGYALAPCTIYRHVRSLEPAHTLRASSGGVETRRYWDLTRFEDDLRGEDTILEDLDGKLRAAVAARLESEVPLGAFLSGGLDSGLVVSYMADTMQEPVITTSVGFGDNAHNELDAAALTAGHCRTAHHPEVVEPALDQVLDRIVSAFDQPFADSSAIPTYYVSAMARQHVTVALTGDGGDEAFGGYDFRYVPHAIEDRVRRHVPAAARGLLGAVGRAWPRRPGLPRPLRLGNVLENLEHDAATGYYLDLCFLKPAATARLLGRASRPDVLATPAYAAVTDVYRRCPATDPVLRAQYADVHVYLPNDVLVKVDRMSMQHALEVRCPLLDRSIVELAFRVPASVRVPHLEPKHLLRRLGRSRLPASLLTLPKHGFTAPVGSWIAGPFRERFLADVTGTHAFVGSALDRSQVLSALDEQSRGTSDRSYLLWAVWMLERWAQQQFVRVER